MRRSPRDLAARAQGNSGTSRDTTTWRGDAEPRPHEEERVREPQEILLHIFEFQQLGNVSGSAGKALHEQRRKIENMLAKLEDWRRIAMRHNRCARTFFAAICIAAAVLFYL